MSGDFGRDIFDDDPFFNGSDDMFGARGSLGGRSLFQGSMFGNDLVGPNSSSTMSSTSYYSSSSTNGGKPVVVERSSHHTRHGPSGITESREMFRDSRTGEDGMRLTRGIGDQRRIMSQRRNMNGEIEKEERTENIPEDKRATFDEIWQNKARNVASIRDSGSRDSRDNLRLREK